MKIPFFLIFFTVLCIHQTNAQSPVADTLNIKETKLHSPSKASLMSAVVPGLGQVYNKKYWKVPIVFAAIGLPLYYVISNNKFFKTYKTAYGIRIDGDATTIDEFDGRLSDANLKANVDYFQRNRDFSVILTGLFYMLNIVDAAVDAHFFYFPKNDNLSFNLQPSIQLTKSNQISKGFRLVINL